MEFNINMNGTLLLAYINTLVCGLLAIFNPEALRLYVEALVYICALAGVRALAKSKFKK